MAESEEDLSSSLGSFGAALFAHACNATLDEPVLFLSPLSIATALALAVAGATTGSVCEAELYRALRFGDHVQIAQINQMVAGGIYSGVALKVANSVWTRSSIKKEYIEVIVSTHSAQAGRSWHHFRPDQLVGQ